MRPRFEKDLRGYSEVAKDDPYEVGEPIDEFDNLSVILDWHLEKAAERQHTNKDVQKKIYDLQKRKQEIMERLKAQLACLDNPECETEKGEGERPAQFDAEQNGFKYLDDNHKEQIATLGDLIADIDWDVYYSLDKSAPRLMIKKYLIERAKKEIKNLLDFQIIESEAGGDIIDQGKRQTYEIIREDRKSGKDKETGGFIAEGIVHGMLKRLSIDREDLPFKLYEGDVYQDVEQKIDFVIHLKERRRGVDVETDEKAEDVGIQFTTNRLAEEHKRKQIEKSKQRLREEQERIQDIALVIFPIKKIKNVIARWEKSGRSAGGPAKLLNRETARKLFVNLLKDMLPQDKIEEVWQKIQGDFPDTEQLQQLNHGTQN